MAWLELAHHELEGLYQRRVLGVATEDQLDWVAMTCCRRLPHRRS